MYANGFQVMSYVPGGEKTLLSGTSMATPQVTSLAAKLLGVHPQLTVAQLREAILSGAEQKVIGQGRRIMLMSPARSLEIANRIVQAGNSPTSH